MTLVPVDSGTGSASASADGRGARRSCAVVVASNRDPALLHACVASLLPQCVAAHADLIVARAGALAPEDIDRLTACGVRLLFAPADATIPELRGRGMQGAVADLVAVTEDHCVADAGWLEALQRAAGTDADVIGGGMDNARRARAVDWGAYFSEYGFFSSERSATPGTDAPPLLTGANVAYARSVAGRVAAWAIAGDWENVAHRRLAAEGRLLRFAPRAVILQNKSYAFGSFCVDRYEHGLDYARTRLALDGTHRRWVLFAATPVLPFLLTIRVARAAARGRLATFLRAVPATFAFLGAWSLGEAVGYLAGPAFAPTQPSHTSLNDSHS